MVLDFLDGLTEVRLGVQHGRPGQHQEWPSGSLHGAVLGSLPVNTDRWSAEGPCAGLEEAGGGSEEEDS